jgi:hypothetical protein
MSLPERDKKFLRRYLEARRWPTLLMLGALGLSAAVCCVWQLRAGTAPLAAADPLPRVLFYLSLGLGAGAAGALFLLVAENMLAGRRLRRVLRKQLLEHLLDGG